MSIKIHRLEAENVKRIKAVTLEPSPSGLTIIGGKNGQGKTSVLNAIAWALGGNKFKPSEPKREESVLPPSLHIVMNNGLVVDRKGKNSDLKVTDPEGNKAGQMLLDSFVEELALDLPKFMQASGKDKAKTLLQIIGVEEELAELEKKEKELYQERLFIGRTADQKEKFAREQEYFTDAPDEIITPTELIKQQQDILARNGWRDQLRNLANEAEKEEEAAKEMLSVRRAALDAAKKAFDEAVERYNAAVEKRESRFYDAESAGEDEPTAEIERSITDIDNINEKVRANLRKLAAEDDAKEYRHRYDALTVEIEQVRQAQVDLLAGADLPLPDLSVLDGELVYKGQKWDNMSSSEQLKVSTAIVRKLKPQCGFILLDKLEQMDLDTLAEFGAWLEAEGLQAIATRVSTGDECSVIIEDGYAAATREPINKPKTWEGAF